MTLSITRIATLEDLHTHLQWAIELEHSILPPYFCALYSIDPTRNAEAAFGPEALELFLRPRTAEVGGAAAATWTHVGSAPA